MGPFPRLLLQTEVAERLKCSVSKVRLLRAQGHLPYLPGRPLLVAETDLVAYEATVQAKRDERLAETQNHQRMMDRVRIRLSLGRSPFPPRKPG